MKRWLPLVLVALAAAAPSEVRSQYFFFDTNGDEACGQLGDCYAGNAVQIDVWLDTNHDEYGADRTCAGGEPLTLSSYELVFQKWASAVNGTAIFGAWTNAIPGFTEVGTRVESGDYLRVGFAGSTLPPGKHRLGTLSFTGLGCVSLALGAFPDGSFTTGFGSGCPGTRQDNFLRLYEDAGYCYRGCFCSDVRGTTWGTIKSLYK